MENFNSIDPEQYGEWLNIKEVLSFNKQKEKAFTETDDKISLQLILDEIKILRDRLDDIQQSNNTHSASILNQFDLPIYTEEKEEDKKTLEDISKNFSRVKVDTSNISLDASVPNNLILDQNLQNVISSIQKKSILPKEEEEVMDFLSRDVVIAKKNSDQGKFIKESFFAFLEDFQNDNAFPITWNKSEITSQNETVIEPVKLDSDDTFVFEDSENDLSTTLAEEINLLSDDVNNNEIKLSDFEEYEDNADVDSESENLKLVDHMESSSSNDFLPDIYRESDLDDLDLMQVKDIAVAINDESIEYKDLYYGLMDSNEITDDNFNQVSHIDTWLDSVNKGDAMMSYELSVDMKSEMRAMIAYFDDFLKDLPEDRVVEFANSPAFELYKKLYQELGVKSHGSISKS